MEMDSWGLDCVVSGSQKGFGIPPGLAFISLSERAWYHISERPKFYFDLSLEKKNQATGSSSWTPGISLVAALKITLQQMHDATLDAVFDHHTKAANAVRKGAEAMGLELLSSEHHSNAVTAIKIPKNVDGLELVSHLRENYSAIFAGGQDKLKGKIIRFGHLGFFDILDIVAGMGALEMALKDCGYDFKLGAGTAEVLKLLRSGA